MSFIRDGEYQPLNRGGRILAVFFGPCGVPLLIAIGWLPILAVPGVRFSMAYFFTVTLVSSLCAVLVLLGQCAYLLLRLRRHVVARFRDQGRSM